MEESQMRLRPRFVMGLLVTFVVIGVLFFGGVPSERRKAKAKVMLARIETQFIAESLANQAAKTGGLSNLAKEFILDSLRASHENQYLIATRTNLSSEVVDVWFTPFQIKLLTLTNFSVSSAGPNRTFGDQDDITFNGALNGFTKQ